MIGQTMRIGISCFGYRPGESGGTQVYIRELVSALAQSDMSNEYFVLSWEEDESPITGAPSANLHRVTWPAPSRALGARCRRIITYYGIRGWKDDLARAVARLALDGIHFPATTIIPSNLTANPVLTFFDMQHEFYPQYFSAPTRLKRLLTYKASALRAVRVISPSHFTTGTLMQRYRVPASKICEIPVGVADDFSTHLPAAHIAAVRQHYALPDKFVLYPANTWPHKNHDRLLQALALLLGQYHEAITLVCTGAQLQEQVSLRELAQRHALLDQQVQHLGYVRPEHMPALYCAATLLVFPSLFEGFGIPVVEAMACGCPVVCANTTSLPEVVGEAAITFDPFDVSSIADSLHSVWNSPKLQSWLRQVGLRRAERYRWSRIIPLIRRVYAEAWC